MWVLMTRLKGGFRAWKAWDADNSRYCFTWTAPGEQPPDFSSDFEVWYDFRAMERSLREMIAKLDKS